MTKIEIAGNAGTFYFIYIYWLLCPSGELIADLVIIDLCIGEKWGRIKTCLKNKKKKLHFLWLSFKGGTKLELFLNTYLFAWNALYSLNGIVNFKVVSK